MPVRFLIVDDDELTAEVIGGFLEAAYPDAEVRLAFNNDEAFMRMEGWAPSLITSDIVRPWEDGYEFLNRLRADPKTRYIPVVAISGANAKEAEQLRQYKHGFNAVITKPFPVEDLQETINDLLHIRSNPDAALIHAGSESPDRDFKELIDISTKTGRASLAKDIIAFANYGGGRIIVGVAEPVSGSFEPCGLPDALLKSCEVTKLNQALRDFIDPPIHVAVRSVVDGTRNFLFIEVPPANDVPILARKKNDSAGLFPGRIYTRTTAVSSSEVQTSAELRVVLSRFK